MEPLVNNCTEALNSTDCLLRVLITFLEESQRSDDSEYNWDPLTFGFTVAISLSAALFALVTIFQAILAAGQGRRKSDAHAIGRWSAKTEWKWSLYDFSFRHISNTPVMTLSSFQHILKTSGSISDKESLNFKEPSEPNRALILMRSKLKSLLALLLKGAIKCVCNLFCSVLLIANWVASKKKALSFFKLLFKWVLKPLFLWVLVPLLWILKPLFKLLWNRGLLYLVLKIWKVCMVFHVEPAATWVAFMHNIGLGKIGMTRFPLRRNNADYIPSDMVAVPAYAEIGFIVTTMSVADAQIRMHQDETYPSMRGKACQFDIRDHATLGTIGVYSAYSADMDLDFEYIFQHSLERFILRASRDVFSWAWHNLGIKDVWGIIKKVIVSLKDTYMTDQNTPPTPSQDRSPTPSDSDHRTLAPIPDGATIPAQEGTDSPSRDGTPTHVQDGTPASSRNGTLENVRDGTPTPTRDGASSCSRDGTPGRVQDETPASIPEDSCGPAQEEIAKNILAIRNARGEMDLRTFPQNQDIEQVEEEQQEQNQNMEPEIGSRVSETTLESRASYNSYSSDYTTTQAESNNNETIEVRMRGCVDHRLECPRCQSWLLLPSRELPNLFKMLTALTPEFAPVVFPWSNLQLTQPLNALVANSRYFSRLDLNHPPNHLSDLIFPDEQRQCLLGDHPSMEACPCYIIHSICAKLLESEIAFKQYVAGFQQSRRTELRNNILRLLHEIDSWVELEESSDVQQSSSCRNFKLYRDALTVLDISASFESGEPKVSDMTRSYDGLLSDCTDFILRRIPQTLNDDSIEPPIKLKRITELLYVRMATEDLERIEIFIDHLRIVSQLPALPSSQLWMAWMSPQSDDPARSSLIAHVIIWRTVLICALYGMANDNSSLLNSGVWSDIIPIV